MTRFAKELRKRGYKLECDYPWLPYDIGSSSIETVIVNSEDCTLHEWYNTMGWVTTKFDRQMKEEVVFEL